MLQGTPWLHPGPFILHPAFWRRQPDLLAVKVSDAQTSQVKQYWRDPVSNVAPCFDHNMLAQSSFLLCILLQELQMARTIMEGYIYCQALTCLEWIETQKGKTIAHSRCLDSGTGSVRRGRGGRCSTRRGYQGIDGEVVLAISEREV